ncbi:TCR/Tet family MFS transporter [Polycladidibacter stylochi]|uniref:TCR/Tet family MFS transporter n=1 Tax=Polycladidibacter stylochi TaxID=1807766 RepID=UPI00083399EE|nr:TCR/Tet family MFS transporter [Pseudovibrio stylochi]
MPASPVPQAKNKRPIAILIFIGGTSFLNAVGAGLIIPVMPSLITELSARDISGAAALGGYIAALYAGMQFLCGSTYGALSDRFGRRPVLLFSLFVLVIDYLIMTFTQSLWLLFVGRLIAGAASATYATAYASIADISGNRTRAKRFGMVGACIGAGFIFGPVIGGVLGEIGTRVPFYCAAILMALTLTYGLFYMPETLPNDRRRAFSFHKANPIGAVTQIVRLSRIGWFMTALVLFQFANNAYTVIWPYFTMEAFGWSSTQVGLSLAVVGFGFSGVKGGLIRFVVPKYGEATTALVGFLCATLALLGFALAQNNLTIMLLLPLSVLGALVPPALTGLMSCLVPQDYQGTMQGALSSLFGLTMVVSTLVMTQLFTAATHHEETVYFPGAPFLLAFVAMLAGLLTFWRALQRLRQQRHS